MDEQCNLKFGSTLFTNCKIFISFYSLVGPLSFLLIFSFFPLSFSFAPPISLLYSLYSLGWFDFGGLWFDFGGCGPMVEVVGGGCGSGGFWFDGVSCEWWVWVVVVCGGGRYHRGFVCLFVLFCFVFFFFKCYFNVLYILF